MCLDLISQKQEKSTHEARSWGDYFDNHGEHGFLLSGGNLETIDVPGASTTAVVGINAEGDIVGWYIDSHGEHGFLLSKKSRRS
jgi:hypothetical protein